MIHCGPIYCGPRWGRDEGCRRTAMARTSFPSRCFVRVIQPNVCLYVFSIINHLHVTCYILYDVYTVLEGAADENRVVLSCDWKRICTIPTLDGKISSSFTPERPPPYTFFCPARALPVPRNNWLYVCEVVSHPRQVLPRNGFCRRHHECTRSLLHTYAPCPTCHELDRQQYATYCCVLDII